MYFDQKLFTPRLRVSVVQSPSFASQQSLKTHIYYGYNNMKRTCKSPLCRLASGHIRDSGSAPLTFCAAIISTDLRKVVFSSHVMSNAEVKYLHQVHCRNRIRRPTGNLLDRVFGTQFSNLHSDDFCQAPSYLLRNVSLMRGKVQANKRDNQGPVYWFTAARPNHSTQGHQHNNGTEIDVQLRKDQSPASRERDSFLHRFDFARARSTGLHHPRPRSQTSPLTRIVL